MMIMKKSQKIGVCLITIVLTLSLLSPATVSQTTIDDSTIAVEVDDIIAWKCTYLHISLYPFFYGVGSILEYTIEDISRGSHGGLSYALIVNITSKFGYERENFTSIVNYPEYMVYNKSLNFIEYNNSIPALHSFKAFIIPFPLNLTLIADYFESLGDTCEVDGNKLRFIDGNEVRENTYNSDGILTKYEWRADGTLAMQYKLAGPSKDEIPFGNFFLLFTIITVLALIVIFRKKT
jgi:hypothetical protein